jgi:hypothetical protein
MSLRRWEPDILSYNAAFAIDSTWSDRDAFDRRYSAGFADWADHWNDTSNDRSVSVRESGRARREGSERWW